MNIQQAFGGIADAITSRMDMETGNYSWYSRKISKHISNGDVERVCTYLRIYYSFNEVSKEDARRRFPEAIAFLRSNGIILKATNPSNDVFVLANNPEEGYKQLLVTKDGQLLYMPSHYPNGYKHYFEFE